MREILFRGKGKNEWHYGCLTRYSEEKSYITVDLLEEEVYLVETNTVGQFTGLLDKHGNKIFEGDILHITDKSTDIIHTVIFKDAAFVLDNKNLYTALIHLVNQNYTIQAIGNIHDNPELLEGK